MKKVISFSEINYKTEFKYIQGIFFKFKYIQVFLKEFRDSSIFKYFQGRYGPCDLYGKSAPGSVLGFS